MRCLHDWWSARLSSAASIETAVETMLAQPGCHDRATISE